MHPVFALSALLLACDPAHEPTSEAPPLVEEPGLQVPVPPPDAPNRVAEGYDELVSHPGEPPPAAVSAAATPGPEDAPLPSPEVPSGVSEAGYVTFWADQKIGWKLFIGEAYVGQLPVKVELGPGSHMLTLESPDGERTSVVRNIQFDAPGIGISMDLH